MARTHVRHSVPVYPVAVGPPLLRACRTAEGKAELRNNWTDDWLCPSVLWQQLVTANSQGQCACPCLGGVRPF